METFKKNIQNQEKVLSQSPTPDQPRSSFQYFLKPTDLSLHTRRNLSPHLSEKGNTNLK